MKYFSFICGACLFSTLASAQLLDTIAAGSVGAASATQGVKSVGQGLSILQQNKIIQNINQMVMDIKMNSVNGYTGLSKNDFQGSSPFGSLGWNVAAVDANRFFIELSGVDAPSCRRFVELMREAQSVEVNGRSGKSDLCSDNSKIKWIFE